MPFAGWERPGVIGLAAATILLKAQRILPGRNVVVAGAGPLLLVVAKAIVEGGGRVAAIVDANPRSAWFAHAADLLSRPDLLARGIGWVRKLRSHGVPILHGHLLRAVEGDAPSLRAVAVPVDRDGHPRAGAATDRVRLRRRVLRLRPDAGDRRHASRRRLARVRSGAWRMARRSSTPTSDATCPGSTPPATVQVSSAPPPRRCRGGSPRLPPPAISAGSTRARESPERQSARRCARRASAAP